MKLILMLTLTLMTTYAFSQNVEIPKETLSTSFNVSSYYDTKSTASLNLSSWGEGKLLINLNYSITRYAVGQRSLGTTKLSMNLTGLDDGMGSYDVIDKKQRAIGKLNVFNKLVVMFFENDMELDGSFKMMANTTLSFKTSVRVCYNKRNKEIECPRIVER